MKIYRVIECNGEHDGYVELRVGTYANKEKAKQVKKEQEDMCKQAEEQAILCSECYNNADGKCQQLCLSYKSSTINKGECVNYGKSWEPRFFRIEEEEVIEDEV